jgi:phosphate butyryltransferase
MRRGSVAGKDGDLYGLREVLGQTAELGARRMVVVCPYDGATLESLARAGHMGFVEPILLGDERVIRRGADEAGVDLAGFTLTGAGEDEVLERAGAMLLEGRAHFIMKGMVGTGRFIHVLLDPRWGIRTERILSHVGLLEILGSKRLLLMSDGALNILPNFTRKIQIISNAISAARKIGMRAIRVAMLAAVEKVTLPAMPATLDAFLMKKFAETGYFDRDSGPDGGRRPDDERYPDRERYPSREHILIDGPFAFDNAIDWEKAQTKGIAGRVAGRANVLIVPNVETGNVIWKSVTCMEKREAAGVVIGGRFPIVVPSRSDSTDTKFLSIQFARLLMD